MFTRVFTKDSCLLETRHETRVLFVLRDSCLVFARSEVVSAGIWLYIRLVCYLMIVLEAWSLSASFKSVFSCSMGIGYFSFKELCAK